MKNNLTKLISEILFHPYYKNNLYGIEIQRTELHFYGPQDLLIRDVDWREEPTIFHWYLVGGKKGVQQDIP